MTQSNDSSTGKWMALTAALLGWMFDGFEMGLFPLIGKPALRELLGNAVAGAGQALTTQQEEFVKNSVDGWFGVIIAVFLVGAATGGVLFGWLGDRIGRVRAMSLSILAYALFTGLCGFANEAWQIAVLRFLASLGMGGEWSLGVALVNEIWPGRSRAFLAGLIGAAANVGFAMVGFLSLGRARFLSSIDGALASLGVPSDLVTQLLSNGGWRFLMISGALPALLVFFVRIFVPESQKWEHEKERGATGFWSNSDLFGVLIGCLGAMFVIYVWTPDVQNMAVRLIGTAAGLVTAILAFLYPVKQFLARAAAAGALHGSASTGVIRRMLFGASLAGVALLATWGSVQWAPKWASDLGKAVQEDFAAEWTQICSAFGAIVGTIVAAIIADHLGRRPTYALICLTSFGSCLLLYLGNESYGYPFLGSVFLVGATTAAMYGFFPLYFPELFPTAVRATGQGFCFNFGRVLAAIGGLQTATLIRAFDGSFPKAGAALSAIYLIGAVIIWLGPETKGKPLPE